MSGAVVAVVTMAVVGVAGVIFARQAAAMMRSGLPLFTDKMRDRLSTSYVRAYSVTLIALAVFLSLAVLPHVAP